MLLALPGGAAAQRHNSGSSPPTAPPFHSTQPIVPVSSGLGALQLFAVSYGVPAPQSLTRQLQADDDRTRAAALSAIGAPGQYLQHGHIPFPHSVQLDFVPLGANDDLDAILTVELEQHIVSAILLQEDGNWKRVATMLYADAFADTEHTPSTFLRITRSAITHERATAVYRATTVTGTGDTVENEGLLRLLNGHATIVLSFASDVRTCVTPTPGHPRSGCELVHRWVESDTADPTHRILLVTASGHLTPREAADPLAHATQFELAHLRSFACQPFAFSEASSRFEPTANSGPCPTAPGTLVER